MRLTLVTLAGIKIDEDIYSATIPTIDGEISVFPDHEALVTVAKTGVIAVRRERGSAADEYFAISGGVVEIDQSGVSVLVDEADHGDEIIEAETRAALERAVKARDESDNQIQREKAHQLVDRHMVRLKVAELQRRRHR